MKKKEYISPTTEIIKISNERLLVLPVSVKIYDVTGENRGDVNIESSETTDDDAGSKVNPWNSWDDE